MNPSANPTATPAGIIGMPGWFASEQVAGFDRNRWLVSSEYAGGALKEGHAEQSLKLSDLLAKAGLTDTAMLRGTAKMPEFRDGNRVLKVTK